MYMYGRTMLTDEVRVRSMWLVKAEEGCFCSSRGCVDQLFPVRQLMENE